MRLDQIARRRLHAQQLLDSELTTAEQVVEHMLAVQAQDYPVAKWSLAQRATGILDADVDAALTAGTILRTHVLRPTWHFVRPADLRWLVELTAPRVRAVNASMERKLGLDDEVFARSNAALLSALAGGASLTRTEIASLLRARGIEAEGLRLGYLLMRPELELLICSGPLRGKQQTYALLDERVPHPPASVSRDVALTQLVRRYLTSRGPATAKDLATWSSLPITTIRRALEATPGLAPATCGDRTYWAADVERVGAAAASAPIAHLLQGLDEYVVSYSESRDALDVAGLAGRVPAGQVMYQHALVLDGQVVGHWRRDVTARSVTLDTQLVRPLAAAERAAVNREADRYAQFLGKAVTWS